MDVGAAHWPENGPSGQCGGRRMVEDEAAESMTDDGELMVAGDLRAANRA